MYVLNIKFGLTDFNTPFMWKHNEIMIMKTLWFYFNPSQSIYLVQVGTIPKILRFFFQEIVTMVMEHLKKYYFSLKYGF